MSRARLPILVALPAALVTMLGAESAAAQDPQKLGEALERVAPKDRPAYLERLAAKARKAPAAAGSTEDVTGPVLTGFNASTTLNLGKGVAPFKISVKATDDRSGVGDNFQFFAEGPSGQIISAFGGSYYNAKTASFAAGFGNYLPRMLEPGTWKFKYGFGYDYAGNSSYFNEAMLDALGNNTFTVVNNGGYDLVPPTLTGGKVLTPAVSLESYAPGSNKPIKVGAKVTATDAGNTGFAGVKRVDLTFCQLADPATCISLYGVTYATGQATATFNVGLSVGTYYATGTYELSSAELYDQVDNYFKLTGTNFGGSADFAAIFPEGTTITLNP